MSVDLVFGAVVSVTTLVLTKLLEVVIARPSRERDARQDLRQEIAQLWDRLDKQEQKLDVQEQRIDALIRERDGYREERDRYMSERDKALAERDEFKRELDDVLPRLALLTDRVAQLEATMQAAGLPLPAMRRGRDDSAGGAP